MLLLGFEENKELFLALSSALELEKDTLISMVYTNNLLTDKSVSTIMEQVEWAFTDKGIYIKDKAYLRFNKIKGIKEVSDGMSFYIDHKKYQINYSKTHKNMDKIVMESIRFITNRIPSNFSHSSDVVINELLLNEQLIQKNNFTICFGNNIIENDISNILGIFNKSNTILEDALVFYDSSLMQNRSLGILLSATNIKCYQHDSMKEVSFNEIVEEPIITQGFNPSLHIKGYNKAITLEFLSDEDLLLFNFVLQNILELIWREIT